MYNEMMYVERFSKTLFRNVITTIFLIFSIIIIAKHK